MHLSQPIALSNFFIAGINYRKSDADVRGLFSIQQEQYKQLIDIAPSYGITDFFILSTCNRTEIYAFASDPADVCRFLTTYTTGSLELFLSLAYIKNDVDAIEHLFNVAAGLDSQILGDYEIVGQIKQAAKIAKTNNHLGTTLERLINEVLQSSKKIRTTTSLSGGTVSISFAAVQYIKSHFSEPDKKILLIGTGKFGSNTCKNIADYLPGYQVTLMNRTAEKAECLAKSFSFRSDIFENMTKCIEDADVILVSTSAGKPFVLKEHFSAAEKLVIDLSVPCNVDPAIKEIPNITLINVDQLSRVKDETLQMRGREIPLAKKIIASHLEAYMDWYHMRGHVSVLKAVKNKLLTIQTDNIFDPAICMAISGATGKSAEERIQKVITGMAVKMKTKNQRGCNYIEAINDFIAPSN